MTTDFPAERRKRVRIALEVSNMDCERSSCISATRQAKFISQKDETRCYSARAGVFKTIPKMSEEMRNVMSSFGGMKLEQSDHDESIDESYEEMFTVDYKGVQTSLNVAWNSKDHLQKREASALPALPGGPNRLSFNSAVRIASALTSAGRSNKNVKQQVADTIKDKKEPLKKTASDITYSKKTKHLVDRCADVYEKVSEIHDHVQVIRSRSNLSLEEMAADVDISRRTQNRLRLPGSNQPSPSLRRMAITRGLKQRSLDEGRTKPASRDDNSQTLAADKGSKTRQRASTFT